MLNKSDCLSVLVRLGDNGVNADAYIKKLALSTEVPLDVLKFIAQHQGIEVSNFYDRVRKNYNKKKSELYINLVSDTLDTYKVLTTLSSLLNQIFLYASKISEPAEQNKFLTEARAEEITRVLNDYSKTFDITLCTKLLKLIRSDVLVLEYLLDRRELAK